MIKKQKLCNLIYRHPLVKKTEKEEAGKSDVGEEDDSKDWKNASGEDPPGGKKDHNATEHDVPGAKKEHDDHGHGNDEEGVDESNPALVKKTEKEEAGKPDAGKGDDSKDGKDAFSEDPPGGKKDHHAPEHDDPGDKKDHEDHGHGNDEDGVDESNPAFVKKAEKEETEESEAGKDKEPENVKKRSGSDSEGGKKGPADDERDTPDNNSEHEGGADDAGDSVGDLEISGGDETLGKTAETLPDEENEPLSDMEMLEFNEGPVDAPVSDWTENVDQSEDSISGEEDWVQALDNDEIDDLSNSEQDELDMESNDVDVPINIDELDNEPPIL